MQATTGGAASQILRAAQHTVFVEGASDQAFDPTVLKELFKMNGLSSVGVEASGPL